MKLVALTVFFAFLAVIAGLPAEPEPYILGGTVVTDSTQHPYLVAIYTVSGSKFCGGYIYSSLYVITAAYCVHEVKQVDDGTGTLVDKTVALPVAELKVTVGMTSQLSAGPYQKDYLVLTISALPGYDMTTNRNAKNLAILKLKTAITYSPGAYFKYYDEVDETNTSPALTLGWGAQSNSGSFGINLRKATVLLESRTRCDTFLTSVVAGVVSDDVICTSRDPAPTGGNPCGFYDEGAPLVQGNVVVGILSQSADCSSTASATNYALYTRLSAHFFWIRSIAGPFPTPTTTPAPLPTAPCVGC